MSTKETQTFSYLTLTFFQEQIKSLLRELLLLDQLFMKYFPHSHMTYGHWMTCPYQSISLSLSKDQYLKKKNNVLARVLRIVSKRTPDIKNVHVSFLLQFLFCRVSTKVRGDFYPFFRLEQLLEG